MCLSFAYATFVPHHEERCSSIEHESVCGNENRTQKKSGQMRQQRRQWKRHKIWWKVQIANHYAIFHRFFRSVQPCSRCDTDRRCKQPHTERHRPCAQSFYAHNMVRFRAFLKTAITDSQSYTHKRTDEDAGDDYNAIHEVIFYSLPTHSPSS